MVSICDDLRRLDEMLLLLSREAARNLQTSLLLSSARRRVQALEKKARSLDAAYCPMASSSNTSGGAAPLSMGVGPFLRLRPSTSSCVKRVTLRTQAMVFSSAPVAKSALAAKMYALPVRWQEGAKYVQ